MRRITLILSDLYLPAEVGQGGAARVAGLPPAVDLPHLDWLLRFARKVERIQDWRSWLSSDLGVFDLERMTVAQCCAQRSMTPQLASHAWLATPVHLEARIDHVRLANRGLIRIPAAERESWRQEFALAFGPTYALHDAGERGFFLSGASQAKVASEDPARLLDADIGRALPTGPAAGELRRLGTEIEMWLHGAATNAAREQRRERRVTALWLWGGGVGEAAPVPAVSAGSGETSRFFGGDPFLNALGNGALNPPPASFHGPDSNARRVVAEFAPMSGSPEESLPALDTNWFARIRAELRSGRLSAVDLIANDRVFHIAARAGWRIWRRRSPWLEQLASLPQ